MTTNQTPPHQQVLWAVLGDDLQGIPDPARSFVDHHSVRTTGRTSAAAGFARSEAMGQAEAKAARRAVVREGEQIILVILEEKIHTSANQMELQLTVSARVFKGSYTIESTEMTGPLTLRESGRASLLSKDPAPLWNGKPQNHSLVHPAFFPLGLEAVDAVRRIIGYPAIRPWVHRPLLFDPAELRKRFAPDGPYIHFGVVSPTSHDAMNLKAIVEVDTTAASHVVQICVVDPQLRGRDLLAAFISGWPTPDSTPLVAYLDPNHTNATRTYAAMGFRAVTDQTCEHGRLRYERAVSVPV